MATLSQTLTRALAATIITAAAAGAAGCSMTCCGTRRCSGRTSMSGCTAKGSCNAGKATCGGCKAN